MGWISRLFGRKHRLEKDVVNQYVMLWQRMGRMSEAEATEIVNTHIDIVLSEALASGADQLPKCAGDYLLASERDHPEIAKTLNAKRGQGVRDEDIRWWWNLTFLERGLLVKMDDTFRMVMFDSLREKGIPPDTAGKRVNRFHPQFGDTTETCESDGADGPLPFELKDRINRYIEKRSNTDPTAYEADIEASSSFNALIRKEIRDGKV